LKTKGNGLIRNCNL